MQTDDEFIAEHAPWVSRIAGRLSAQLDIRGVEREEIEAWGHVGLLEARARFDARPGVRFTTFAYYRVRGAMLDGVRRSGYVSRRAHAKLRAAEATDALTEPLAEGTAPQGLAARASQLDDTLGKLTAAYTIAAVGQDTELHDAPSAEERVEASELHRLLRGALGELPERERALLAGVYFEGRTLEAVGKELGLSKSWASRLHSKVLGKLRTELAEDSG